MLITKIINQICGEIPLWQTNWQGISLNELARDKELPIDKVAASDFYDAFYEKLHDTQFNLDLDWVKEKKELSKMMQKYVDDRLRVQPKARFLSLGAGIGIVEEDLLSDGIHIDLQECQPHSFDYLRSKNIQFKEYIGTDLSVIPDSSYDYIFVFTLSYVYSYSEYKRFFESVYQILSNGGQVLLMELCPEKISHRLLYVLKYPLQIAKKIIKRLLGHPIPQKGVFWGWLRYSYLHQYLAKRAGFLVEDAFKIDDTSQWFVFRK